jgi:hypothetical protein
MTSGKYKLSIFVKGFPGSYQYRVGTKDQAMTHFAAITANGYRRRNDRGQLIWYSPSMIEQVKVEGPGLQTNYPDKFVRT